MLSTVTASSAGALPELPADLAGGERGADPLAGDPLPGDPLGVAPLPGEPRPDYAAFHLRVVAEQVRAWAAGGGGLALDLSGEQAGTTAALLAAGYEVIQVSPSHPGRPPGPPEGRAPRYAVGDLRTLDWVGSGRVDAVVAEGRVLSSCLAMEETVRQMHRVLRPGGRLLACVDSLLWGLARLAEQGRWAELADSPAADVVLVPGPSGEITRCFWPEELYELLTAAGFVVEWVRPRTVLTQAAVERALTADPRAVGTLVRAEIALAIERAGESLGTSLVASARRR